MVQASFVCRIDVLFVGAAGATEGIQLEGFGGTEVALGGMHPVLVEVALGGEDRGLGAPAVGDYALAGGGPVEDQRGEGYLAAVAGLAELGVLGLRTGSFASHF